MNTWVTLSSIHLLPWANGIGGGTFSMTILYLCRRMHKLIPIYRRTSPRYFVNSAGLPRLRQRRHGMRQMFSKGDELRYETQQQLKQAVSSVAFRVVCDSQCYQYSVGT